MSWGRVRQIGLVIAVVGMGGFLLAGCSGTDVELKGGVFDLMGVSGNANSRTTEPELPDRPGIVMPPSTASLPTPGAVPQPAIAANGQSFPVNPEEAKKSQQAAVIVRHREFCEKARQRQLASNSPIIESSPWGACHESVLRNVTGSDLSGNKLPAQ